ncbi:MAG TPA: caspase family protein [Kofleriaceae bacterium]|nr:caspase family protein [Kofleriaceae bacterium]
MAGGPELPRNIDSGLASKSNSQSELSDFGLVVGVDHYPRFRSLRGAVEDAKRFHAWLCDGDGGGVRPDRARLVVSTENPVAPLQDQVDDAIVELLAAADRLGGGRRLYFYFSGHGATSPYVSGDDVALLLAKWSRNLARLALSVEQYRGGLTTVGLFHELAIFLDCCRSSASGAVGLPPTITFDRAGERFPTRCFVAFATEDGRSAFEHADNGQWYGVFTRCLLSILQRSPEGLGADALKDALEREVQQVSRTQRAHVVNGLCPGATFGSRRQTLPQVRVCHHGKQVKLFDGRGILIAERGATPDVWELALAPGLYKLQDDGGKSVLIDHDKEVTSVEI